MEDRRDSDWIERVASALGLVPHQLDGIEWSIDENAGNDGTVYGYIVTFEKSDDAATNEWISQITGGLGFKNIGPNP